MLFKETITFIFSKWYTIYHEKEILSYIKQQIDKKNYIDNTSIDMKSIRKQIYTKNKSVGVIQKSI